MKTFRQNLIDKLQTELAYIRPQAGYKTKTKNVYVGYRNLSQVMEYPSITFYLGTDILLRTDESNTFQYRELDLVILGYLQANTQASNDGSLTTQIERLYSDISNFIYGSANVQQNQTTTIDTIPGFLSLSLSEKQSYMEFNQNKCMTGILFKIEYKEDQCNPTSENVSATNNIANA